MHVLLIEPDTILAGTYTRLLERARHTVTHVCGAQEAVRAADENTPDVVVLEMQLAAHSGSAFLYEFRTYSDWLDIPIVVHTLVPPDTTQVYEQSLKCLGVTDILYKPQTSLRQLLGAIESVQMVR